MRNLLLLGALFALLPACEGESPNSVTLSPAHDGSFAAIEVDIAFALPDSGALRIEFPSQWGPEEHLERLVRDVSVRDAKSEEPVPSTREDGAVVVRGEPRQRLNLNYVVAQDYEGEPHWGAQRVPGMRPVLQPGYATIVGHTVIPEIDDAEYEVRFRGIPEGATAAFSRPTNAQGVTSPANLDAIRDGIFTWGDFRYRESRSEALLLRTSIRGDWALSDEEVATTARDVISTASTMFEDAPFQQYFVAMSAMPALPQGSSVIGTGLGESFFILATPNASASRLTHTIVHEVLHEWITRRMGATDEATDPTRMWFTEGFTEYFTQITLLKSGLVTLDGFLANLNELLRGYQKSSVRNMPAAELQERVWESRETERLPYQRGALLALHWDTIARSGMGRPLAKAIAALLDEADTKRAMGQAAVLTDEAIRSALSTVVGPAFQRDYDEVLVAGENLDLENLRVPDCITVETGPDGIFEFRAIAATAACVSTFVNEGR